MSEPESVLLEARVKELEEQLRLAKQMLFRVHNTLMQVTKGQEIRTVLKPDSVEKSITLAVPDDSPDIYLTATRQNVAKVSPILTNSGEQFRRNGAH